MGDADSAGEEEAQRCKSSGFVAILVEAEAWLEGMRAVRRPRRVDVFIS